MKKIFYIFMFVLLFYTTNFSQQVYGYIADTNGLRLYNLTVKTYIGGNCHTDTTTILGFFGWLNPVGIDKNGELPTGYAVANNYPNPFNPRTRIEFKMPEAGQVKVNVYNILGQEVIGGINKNFAAGTNHIDIEMNGLPNGVYIARIKLNDKYETTKKLMLLYGSQHLNVSSNNPDFNISEVKKSNTALTNVPIDSVVVSGYYVKTTKFTGLPNYTGGDVPLGIKVVKRVSPGNPCPGIATVIYRGQTYHTVQIGSQCWLRENLNVGTMLDSLQYPQQDTVIEKWCYYHMESNCAKYGGLYSWNEAMKYGTTQNSQGICPNGWHVPLRDEFKQLLSVVDSVGRPLDEIWQGNFSGTTVASYGTNTTGFTALLGGFHNNNGFSMGMGSDAFWSSTSVADAGGQHYWWFTMEIDGVNVATVGPAIDYMNMYMGYSVRCIKDQ